ncbi:MAG: extracellular solute-binding protein [Anaerolineales bacterium]|nr:extracellular solute-binding protein [Anaerolineales bacterium]
MKELEITLMSASANPTADMLALVQDFHPAQVNIHTTQWNSARSELVNFALLKNTPDISEVGSTWISGFSSMQALRPFSDQEVRRLGSPDAYVPQAWESGILADRGLYGIPWTLDVRNIYYRRDLFAQAGIDEATAFQDLDTLRESWRRLQAAGVEIPWVLTTSNTLSTLHYLASWVWGNGGHFISEDGKKPRFNEPEAKEGIYQYFLTQLPFMTEESHDLGDTESANLFAQGKAASIYSGYWLFDMIQNNPDLPSEVIQNVGIAKFPLPAFIGGSHLVLWRDSHHSGDAIALVEHLTSRAIQATLPGRFSQIPARLDALADTFPESDPNSKAILESLKTGQTFTAPYMWGMVESRLLPTIVGTWKELCENPEMDLKNRLDQRLDGLANRLQTAFSSI